MTVTRLIARPMLASIFAVGGYNALRHSAAHAEKAKPITDRVAPMLDQATPDNVAVPQDPQTLVRINAGVQLAAAAALATGKFPRLASAVLASSLVPTTAAGHRFWEETDPAAKTQQQIHFFKNLSLFGGLLLAAVDTEAKPGLAWRASHLASGVGKDARHLRRTAGLEAKLAAKSIAS